MCSLGYSIVNFGSYVLFNEVKTHEKTKLIVCGHVHDAMESDREDGVKFINPGSVCREKLNEANKVKEPNTAPLGHLNHVRKNIQSIKTKDKFAGLL